ncbi:MAG: helix-turn-helix domain-containing protein, partial [Treponema sp.]|nr:helix-turn-helix domain-containing protein [Treponema sp.]
LDTVRETLETRIRIHDPQNDPELERQFLRKTIWKAIAPEEWSRCKERFKLPSDKGIVLMVELDQDQEKWCEKIAEKLSLRYHCCYDIMLNRGLFLISADLSRDALRGQIEPLFKELFPSSSPNAITYFYGVGDLRHGPDLYLSCNEALRELQDKRNLTDLQLRERLRIIQLRHKIGITGAGEAKKLFNALWEEAFASHDFTLAKAKMAAVFMLFIDDCTGCYSGHSDEEPLFNAVEEIMPLKDVAEWERWAAEAFEKLLFQATLRRSGNFPLPLVKAIEFIHAHYTEGLQLSAAADAAQISPAYLSRLFSEHLKTTFIDYITDLRIENAEKLIRESRMNMKEIAFAVGYQDPNYFSKIFRKATGLPPTSYAIEKRDAGGV